MAPSTIFFPYCKYNNSLNKYLFYNSNLDICLDDFSFYSRVYIKPLNIIKKYFAERFLSALYTPAPVGVFAGFRSAAVEFAQFILDQGVNPFLQLWEETLANWPTCPGTSLLDLCRTQYELRREAAEASAERAALQRQKRDAAIKDIMSKIGCGRGAALAAYKEGKGAVARLRVQYERKRRVVLSLVVKARALLAYDEAKKLRRELFPSTETVESTKLGALSAAQAKAEKQIAQYAQLTTRIWRVKRQERAAARIQRERELLEAFEKATPTAATPVKVEKPVKRTRWQRVASEPVQHPCRDLIPYKGLGAVTADPECAAIMQCGKFLKTCPELVSEVVNLLTTKSRQWADRSPVFKFVKDLAFLADHYPQEVLASELHAIENQEQLQVEAKHVAEEAKNMAEFIRDSNCRAGLFGAIPRIASAMASASIMHARRLGFAFTRGVSESAYAVGSKFADGIMDAMLGQFHKTIQNFKSQLGCGMELVHVLVARIKQWAKNIIAKISDVLQCLGEYVWYAIGILMGVGLCCLLENVLGANRLLSTLFCTGVFGIIAVKMGGGFDKWRAEMISKLTTLACAIFTRNISASTGINCRSVPLLSSAVGALTSFATSLSTFNTSTVIELGKLGAACHSIRNGKEALKELCANIFYYFGRMADVITGQETVFFDELSTLVSVDVRGWIKKAQSCLLEANYTPLGGEVFLDQVNRLVEQGHRLQVGVSGIPRKVSADYAHLIGTVMKDLRDLLKRCVRAGQSEGRRPEPAWIYLHGPSHCGKTNFMETLGVRLCKHFQYPYTVCSRNPKDNFFSGYNGQTILQFDDLSSIRTEPPIEGEMINLVSCNEYALNMADVEDKPIYFRSPFVLSSSNFVDVPTAAGVRDIEAYRNRKLCSVEMRRRPGSTFNPDDPLAASQARFLDPRTQMVEFVRDNDVETAWMDMEDVIVEIINRVQAHRAKEQKLQNKAMAARAEVDPVMLASETFLKKEAVKAYCSFPQLELDKAGIQATQGKGLCVDGTLYLLNAGFELDAHKVTDESYARLWEERTLKHFLRKVQSEGHLETRSMIVTGFLRSLVSNQCAVVSVGELSNTATLCQERIFRALQLNERVYLRAVQKATDKLRAEFPENPYSNTYWNQFLQTIARGAQMVRENGMGILMVAAAMILLLVTVWGFWKCLIGLFSGSMSLAAAMTGVNAVELKSVHSSGSVEKGYRARNIPVNTRYNYLRGGEQLPPAARLAVAIFSPNGAFVSGMQYQGKSIALTRHQALNFDEGSTLTCVFASTGESKTVRFRQCHLVQPSGSEIVFWMAPTLPELPHELKGLFLLDKETELPAHFKTEGWVLRKDVKGQESSAGFHYDQLDSFVAVDHTPLVLNGIVQNDKYLHEIPERLTFHYAARNDDCGMMLLCQIGGKMKVVGMLVAGKDKTSWGCILPNPHFAEVKSLIEYFPKLGEAEEGFYKVGYLAPDKAPRMPKKTNLCAVPEELRVPTSVEIKEPSVISKEDPRCPPAVDPPLAALRKKFTKPMDDLDQKIVDEVARDICESWEDCPDSFLQDIPLSVAINGVPAGTEEQELENFVMKSSPGWPYTTSKDRILGKGKHPYFEEDLDGSLKIKEGSLAAELYENIVEVSKEQVPQLVVTECPKDELLPKRKIVNGACRLFEIMPLHYNLFLRVKTCAFTQFIQNNRHRLPCQVGTNVYSREWSHIFTRLGKFGNQAINCDYSAFDGLLNDQMTETIARMINTLYARAGDSEVSQRQRFNMIMALCGRYALLGQDVYKVRGGLPSGFALTVVVNSIFNEILIRYCFKVLSPEPEKYQFRQCVCLLVYGDDNLISCHTSVQDWFNGEAIRLKLKESSITITDGSDKTAPTIEWKSLEELDFLKRRFRKENGIIYAPLDKSAIFSCLHWLTPEKSKFHKSQKPGDYKGPVDCVTELLPNVNLALTELYLHGNKEEFSRVRNFYVQHKTFGIFAPKVTTWAECESFHSRQQTGMLTSDPAPVLDIMVGPEFARFMRNSDIGHTKHHYLPNIAVCGPFYTGGPGEYIVSTEPLKGGEKGSHIPIVCGAGVGGLPTKNWVRNFGSPARLKDHLGYKCYHSMVAALEAGDVLIFRSKAPYVAGNAAAICFASQHKLADQRSLLQLYRNIIPESLTGLEEYFDAPMPAANVGKFYFSNGETYHELSPFKKVGEVLSIQEPRLQDQLNEASRLGKVPCIAAQPYKKKFKVGLACNKTSCPHHIVTAESYEAAFKLCWIAKCKTPGNQVGTWVGTTFASDVW